MTTRDRQYWLASSPWPTMSDWNQAASDALRTAGNEVLTLEEGSQHARAYLEASALLDGAAGIEEEDGPPVRAERRERPAGWMGRGGAIRGMAAPVRFPVLGATGTRPAGTPIPSQGRDGCSSDREGSR